VVEASPEHHQLGELEAEPLAASEEQLSVQAEASVVQLPEAALKAWLLAEEWWLAGAYQEHRPEEVSQC
jgi:hypothetical protein